MIDRLETSADALWLTPQAPGVVRLGFADNGRELVGPVKRLTWKIQTGHVNLGDPFLEVEGTTETLVLRFPLAGRIKQINTDLAAHPDWLDTHNDARDWMVDLDDE
ncbi:glycine cleavage system H protein (lipoate-binding) [Levilactobacillus zymae]|uniref:glycine cleavage system H protein (lipoate-binding) n=1 Tax=Levilactobacillus zymae TaxID=267363 RepID=UPI0028BB0A5F|nr:glycine cleavage system H protein (lipoate-binding) [Levilactobacillus zymae]MDT6981101.1 glycine cleavage system H protein (lipoate-binding) [Levilactobacillus zymae]